MTCHSPPESPTSFDVGAPDALERMVELFARHGDIYRMYVPSRGAYTYVIHHPDDVKRVLLSNHRNYTKGADRDRIKILLGLGLMTSEGELWKRHHDLMQPMFHSRVISRFAEVIETSNDRFLSQLESRRRRGEYINITEATSELTLEIVLGAIFGNDVAEVAAAFAVTSKESARDLDFVYRFRSLGAIVAKVIRRRRERGDESRDYLGLLMAARDGRTGVALSEREIIDEVLTLVVAGHETTASVLNWAWYLLSQHSEVETRLLAELGRAGPAEGDVLEKGYVRQVLNETMRLYPPGWLLSRRAMAADVLGGYEVPSGANVLIPLYLLHRHPRYWPEPERFDPDRFSPARESERPKYAFLPFSAGPRHCIGEPLALFEMLLHLRKVVPQYRLIFIPDEPLELEAQINLRTRYPLRMTIERR
ncbi:MAG TPA: cytochrome P450 [Steroidobacteraceae bacterium]|nr:cytochrome P450 [Steroidobacteraceae bacterium]